MKKKQTIDKNINSITLDDIHNNPKFPKDEFLLSLKLTDIVMDKYKEGKILESFIFAAQTLEAVILPRITHAVMNKLKVGHRFSLYERLSFSNLNLVYLVLTQDEELFNSLEKFRSLRNKIIHKVTSFSSEKNVEEEAKNGLRIFSKIWSEIDNRERGKTPIPVLTLYIKGYNDRGKHVRDRILKLFNDEEKPKGKK